MVGKMSVISTAQRKVIAVLDTGVETNHPNFATVDGIVYGFTTVAAVNLTRVYMQPDPDAAPVFVRDILASGTEPHGLWASPDNTHLYVVNEHTDTVDFISLETWSIVKTVKVGQEGQALVYVANAVPNGDGTQNLHAGSLGKSGH
jgi:YVTN family beta-propeller protein